MLSPVVLDPMIDVLETMVAMVKFIVLVTPSVQLGIHSTMTRNVFRQVPGEAVEETETFLICMELSVTSLSYQAVESLACQAKTSCGRRRQEVCYVDYKFWWEVVEQARPS